MEDGVMELLETLTKVPRIHSFIPLILNTNSVVGSLIFAKELTLKTKRGKTPLIS